MPLFSKRNVFTELKFLLIISPQGLKMSEQSLKINHENESSLKEIIDFVAKSWVSIFSFFAVGIVFAIAYISIVPNKYEAIMHLQMAQISSGNTLLQKANLEEPSVLIARLKIPYSYSENVINACSSGAKKNRGQDLVQMFNYSLVKGASSIIQVKLQMNEKNVAVNCLKGLFDSIRDSQYQIVEADVEEAKTLLVEYRKNLKKSLNTIAKADESGIALSAAYLSTRDNIIFLNQEIIRLDNFIKSSYLLKTKLMGPIFVSDNPVFPNKRFILIVGGVIGLCLGFLFSLFNHFLSQFNSKLTKRNTI